MQIILLERVKNLGFMGDIVTVKDGYARNFLLPQKKALRATKANLEDFKARQKELEVINLQEKKEAEQAAKKLDKFMVTIIANAGESGQLYGAVNSRTIAQAMTDAGTKTDYHQIDTRKPIKTVGIHTVNLILHPEVEVEVMVNVASSEDQAKIQLEELNKADTEKKSSTSGKKSSSANNTPSTDAEEKDN